MRGAEHGQLLLVRLARRLIAWSLPLRDRALLNELDEMYRDRLAAQGLAGAAFWYARQAAGFVVRMGAARTKEELRATSGGAGTRHALRSLRRRPAWVLGVVATLGVGVGGVASVYAVARWTILRPVPGVEAGEDFVVLRLGSQVAPPHVTWSVSHRDYEMLRRELPLRDLAAATPHDVHVHADGVTRRVAAELVSMNYFDVLGVRLLAGRTFAEGDAGGEVIVSSAVARVLAGSPADAVGSNVMVNGRSLRVIGVAPAGFRGAELPGAAELWLELASLPVIDRDAPADAPSRGGYEVWRRMYGRIAPGATAERVALVANSVMERLQTSGEPTTFVVTHYRIFADAGLGPDPTIRASLRETFTLLGGAAAFLLLLSVANVANLSAMDASSRHGALAIRFALGARRRTLAAQWLTESVLLGVTGAAAALFVAATLHTAFRTLRLDTYGAPLHELRLDANVLTVTLVVGVIASLVAALPVMFAAGSVQVLSLLGRARRGGSRGRIVRSAFVVIQVALSLVLVAGAALMGRTVDNLRAIDLGFDVDDVVVFSLDPSLDARDPGARLDQLARIEESLLARPEVIAAGFISPSPLAGSWLTAHVFRDGGSGDDGVMRGAAAYSVTPGFLRVLGSAVTPPTQSGEVVVTENVAARAYPELPPRAATGMLLRQVRRELPLTITGVVPDMRLHGRQDVWPFTLLTRLDTAQLDRSVTGWVRATPGAAGIPHVIRQVLASHAPDLPAFDLMSARDRLDRLSSQQVLLARVALLLGLLGLTLAMVGLYAVLGRSVAERYHELGVRAALGATHRHQLRDVALHGLRLGTIGCAIGSAAALLAGRTLGALLYEVSAVDPLTHVAAALLVLTVVLVATLLPAVRAMRVSPLTAIRQEM